MSIIDPRTELNATQIGLLQRSILHINGTIDDSTLKYVQNAMMVLNASGTPDIEVRITTVGGGISEGLAMYDLFRLYEGNTTGVVYNTAMSMGVIILQGCRVRKAMRYATILIHNPYPVNAGWSLLYAQKGDGKAKFRKEAKKALTQMRDQLYEVIMERTGKTYREVEKESLKDEQMTAQQALEFGLIDEII